MGFAKKGEELGGEIGGKWEKVVNGRDEGMKMRGIGQQGRKGGLAGGAAKAGSRQPWRRPRLCIRDGRKRKEGMENGKGGQNESDGRAQNGLGG